MGSPWSLCPHPKSDPSLSFARSSASGERQGSGCRRQRNVAWDGKFLHVGSDQIDVKPNFLTLCRLCLNVPIPLVVTRLSCWHLLLRERDKNECFFFPTGLYWELAAERLPHWKLEKPVKKVFVLSSNELPECCGCVQG